MATSPVDFRKGHDGLAALVQSHLRHRPFDGAVYGAQNWAVLASLIDTCKLNGIEPHSYLANTLTAIVNGHRQTQIRQLLPWNYAQTV